MSVASTLDIRCGEAHDVGMSAAHIDPAERMEHHYAEACEHDAAAVRHASRYGADAYIVKVAKRKAAGHRAAATRIARRELGT